MPVRSHRASDYLNTPEDIVAYLNAAVEEMGDDPRLLMKAFRNVADARGGVSEVARQAKMDRVARDSIRSPRCRLPVASNSASQRRRWRHETRVATPSIAASTRRCPVGTGSSGDPDRTARCWLVRLSITRPVTQRLPQGACSRLNGVALDGGAKQKEKATVPRRWVSSVARCSVRGGGRGPSPGARYGQYPAAAGSPGPDGGSTRRRAPRAPGFRPARGRRSPGAG